MIFRGFARVPTASTVFITGNGRSGTSAYSYIVAALGFGSLPDSHAVKHEASPLRFDDSGALDLNATSTIIAKLNSRYDRWFWKFPQDLYTRHKWLHIIRSPIFIVVTRNPLSIATSASIKEGLPVFSYFKSISDFYSETATFLNESSCPVIMVSFEELLQNSEKVIRQLAELFSVCLDRSYIEYLVKSVSSGKYISRDDKAIEISEEDKILDSAVSNNLTLRPHIFSQLNNIKVLIDDIDRALNCLNSSMLYFPFYSAELAAISIVISSGRSFGLSDLVTEIDFSIGNLLNRNVLIQNNSEIITQCRNLNDYQIICEDALFRVQAIRRSLQILLDCGR